MGNVVSYTRVVGGFNICTKAWLAVAVGGSNSSCTCSSVFGAVASGSGYSKVGGEVERLLELVAIQSSIVSFDSTDCLLL